MQKYKADILAVDDTPDNLRLLTKLLTEHGYIGVLRIFL